MECKQPILSCPYRETIVDGEDTVIELRCGSIPCQMALEILLKTIVARLDESL